MGIAAVPALSGGKHDAPPPPDFAGIAQGQVQANRPDIQTPFAQQHWGQDSNGQWHLQQGLTGPLAGASDALSAQAAGNLSTPLDYGQFGPLDDGSAAREQAISSAYNQSTRRLDPQWAQRDEAQRAQLANQGLDPNSEAARGAMTDLGHQRNDAYSSAMASAIGQGTAAQAATFGQNLAARQQAIAEALRKRGQPLSELGQLQGFMQMPGFSPDNSSLSAALAQGNYGMQAAQMHNQSQADMLGGFGQLGSSAAMMFALSDARAKTAVSRLGVEALPGVPFATWEYLPEHGGRPGERHVGVIAQDLARVAPAYVRARPDGLLEVDYSFLTEVPHV